MSEHLIRRAPATRPSTPCRGPRRSAPSSHVAGSRKVSGPRRSDDATLGWALAALLVVFQTAQTLSALGVWA